MIRTVFAFRKFLPSVREHRAVEDAALGIFQQFLPERYRAAGKINRRGLQYMQRHFFSTLFLSVYKALGIGPERRRFYGVINHCLRGIVTGADNLLDNEYKELLPLNFPAGAERFKSVMHILLFDRILEQIIRQEAVAGNLDHRMISTLHQSLFAAMLPIGAGEAREEEGVSEILTPAEILSSVHMYKGGELLCLSFVAPLLIETARIEAVRRARDGIRRIGIALQIIDDLTDFYEDLANRNHNYLVSVIFHETVPDEKAALADLIIGPDVSGPPIEQGFPGAVRLVMERGVGEALAGFDLLQLAGYWLDRRQAAKLIRFLFTLRGVPQLLPFFPAETELDRLAGVS